jgi:hypothetical protein
MVGNWTPTSIGKEFGADVVLSGSLREYTGQLHLNVHLMHINTNIVLWAEKYDFPTLSSLKLKHVLRPLWQMRWNCDCPPRSEQILRIVPQVQ